MVFATSARTDMNGLVTAYQAGLVIKIFRHAGGWSVECPNGVLENAGTDQFAQLEPLVDALKAKGIDRVILEA